MNGDFCARWYYQVNKQTNKPEAQNLVACTSRLAQGNKISEGLRLAINKRRNSIISLIIQDVFGIGIAAVNSSEMNDRLRAFGFVLTTIVKKKVGF